MAVKIHPVSLGASKCYIIQDKGIMMIDGGVSRQTKKFLKSIEKLSIKPEDIKLLIITHGHYDHIGSVKEIRDVTGSQIVMHQRDKDYLENASQQSPPPPATKWGGFLIKAFGKIMSSSKVMTTNVDIVLGDEGFSLDKYGIPGKVIYTPGHTFGSISVLLETGDAIVGDLAMSGFPLRLGPGLPIFAQDLQKVKESWKLLLDLGAKTIYPAHGKPFSAHVFRKSLNL